jgi:hypothetical protein
MLTHKTRTKKTSLRNRPTVDAKRSQPLSIETCILMPNPISAAWGKLKNIVGAVPSIRSTYMVADRQLHLLRDSAWISALRTDSRYLDSRSVTRHGFKVYSQNDEDGIIEAILSRIGEGSRRFVEIGVGNGLENNTSYLLQKGWSGAWLDADADRGEFISREFAGLIKAGRLTFRNIFVTAAGIDNVLADMQVPAEVDLLSLDIDGNEWWVWHSLERIRPRVVVVEYNAGLGPSLPWKMPYDPKFRHPGTRAHGASLKAFEHLAAEKGYCLVGCNWTGVNAFFVRGDIVEDKFPKDTSAQYHYEPPRYYFGPFYGGYPADPREFDAVVPREAPIQ